MSRPGRVIIQGPAVAAALLLCFSCKGKTDEAQPHETPRVEEKGLSGEMTIFHAGSLAVPFRHVSAAFMEENPDVKVEHEAGGSRKMIRQITQLGKEADILASSDYVAIRQLMFPEHADWYIAFATNRIVIAYTGKSAFADEINADNWHEILLREGVEFGRGDHNMDPCGYRTLLCWKLAEKHYGKEGLYEKLQEGCGEKNVRPKSEDLVSLVQAGELDFAFEYYSVSRQHKLKFLTLPQEIDLSDASLKEVYSAVQVEVTGKKPSEMQVQKGEPILYAVTVPKNAADKDLACEWIKFLISDRGRHLVRENFQDPLSRPLAFAYDRVPETLKGLVDPFNK